MSKPEIKEFKVANSAETVFGIQMGEGVLVNIHDERLCAGEYCVIHNPSDHRMVDWPMNWRGDRGLMERTCPHGIGHPDPDALDYLERIGRSGEGVHGCDGCC